jgi:serine/threonine-protein kinase
MFHHDVLNSGSSTGSGPLDNRTLWSFTTNGAVVSSPAVVDGVVYVGSGDKNLYALNASTGTKIWNYTIGGVLYGGPAVVDGVVYASATIFRCML